MLAHTSRRKCELGTGRLSSQQPLTGERQHFEYDSDTRWSTPDPRTLFTSFANSCPLLNAATRERCIHTQSRRRNITTYAFFNRLQAVLFLYTETETFLTLFINYIESWNRVNEAHTQPLCHAMLIDKLYCEMKSTTLCRRWQKYSGVH